ncbi:hypothetical protein AEYBE204_19345 [Asticcacaulis sp. YBE204]|nr:hypothetical protein AEYBE204_19345 [Asticcacaulis sp. YBE204]
MWLPRICQGATHGVEHRTNVRAHIKQTLLINAGHLPDRCAIDVVLAIRREDAAFEKVVQIMSQSISFMR